MSERFCWQDLIQFILLDVGFWFDEALKLPSLRSWQIIEHLISKHTRLWRRSEQKWGKGKIKGWAVWTTLIRNHKCSTSFRLAPRSTRWGRGRSLQLKLQLRKGSAQTEYTSFQLTQWHTRRAETGWNAASWARNCGILWTFSGNHKRPSV